MLKLCLLVLLLYFIEINTYGGSHEELLVGN
jgi:hypothetical protein